MGGKSDAPGRREAAALPDAASPRRVVALVAREEDRREVSEVLGADVELHFCSRSEELFRIASELRPHVVVVDPIDADGKVTTPTIQALKAALPMLQVVYCMDLSARAVRSAMEGWAMGLVFRHQQGLGATLRTAIARAPRAGSPGFVLETTSALVPTELRSYFSLCAWNAPRIPNVLTAARNLGIRYRTLANRFRVAGLPPPKEVLDWFRFLHAAWRVEHTRANREAIARQSGFSNGYHMARRLRRCTGLTWTELHERVGFHGLLKMFEDRLREAPIADDAKSRGQALPDAPDDDSGARPDSET
jgi:AraC-like DNA-binding protein